LKPSCCWVSVEHAIERLGPHLELPHDVIAIGDDRRFLRRRLQQRAELRAFHHVERPRSRRAVERDRLDVPVGIVSRGPAHFLGKFRDWLERDDRPFEADLLAQLRGVLPRVRADVEHAVDIERSEEAFEKEILEQDRKLPAAHDPRVEQLFKEIAKAKHPALHCMRPTHHSHRPSASSPENRTAEAESRSHPMRRL
jgi:hypothetical protein